MPKDSEQKSEAAAVSPDQTLNKEAVDEVAQKYSDTDEESQIDAETERELGEVEQALEDSTLGIEDRT